MRPENYIPPKPKSGLVSEENIARSQGKEANHRYELDAEVSEDIETPSSGVSGSGDSKGVSETGKTIIAIDASIKPPHLLPLASPSSLTHADRFGDSEYPYNLDDFQNLDLKAHDSLLRTESDLPARHAQVEALAQARVRQQKMVIEDLKNEKGKEEISQILDERRREIEYRCSLLDPPLGLDMLQYMSHFDYALHIPQPLTQIEWEILLPKLLSQQHEAAELNLAEIREDDEEEQRELSLKDILVLHRPWISKLYIEERKTVAEITQLLSRQKLVVT